MVNREAPVTALATAVCRWHHLHYGQPIPCVHATNEARALLGLLDRVGMKVTTKEAPA